MAYRLEGNEIVIDGWEQGISDNPYKGINDMRGFNIISIPGEASVSFAPTQKTYSSLTVTITSADAGTDIVTATINTGALSTTEGQTIVFAGASLPTGIVAGTIYWIFRQSANTFKLANSYANFLISSYLDITGDGTGTGASINIAEIKSFDKNSLNNYIYCIDLNGRVWFSNAGSMFVYTGNTVDGSTTHGNGICMYTSSDGTRHLFVFRGGQMDYLNEATATWVYEWDPATGANNAGVQTLNSLKTSYARHDTLIFPSNNKMYITDGHYIASLVEKAGQVFDPSNTATYVWAKQDLTLPATDIANCLAVLGLNLLIGGNYNVVYSWDRTSLLFNNIILIADNYIAEMVTVNTNTYIFAGYRGRIYITNSSQANLFAKVPDNIGGVEPIFTWRSAAYNKNQLYFGLTAQINDGSNTTAYNGLWAIDVTTDAMRVPTLNSTVASDVTAIATYQGASTGFGLIVGWKKDFPYAYGIDISSTSLYSTYTNFLETDIIPVGQYLKKRTFENLEWKLSAPMNTQDGIRISYRTNKTSAYALLGETVATATGQISDYYTMNFDQVQWIQFKIETKSSNVAGNGFSGVRLYELRLK